MQSNLYINLLLGKNPNRIHLHLKTKENYTSMSVILHVSLGSREGVLPDRGDKPCVRVVPLWCKNEPHFGIEDWEAG